ncbi:MAG TPA: hypothetical protein VE869_11085 [Gemmatimonas sp.]|nr:hypothetical protein [Gemmatimonas sp.]
MFRHIRESINRTRALRLDAASAGPAGLAFLLAYLIAYVVQAG